MKVNCQDHRKSMEFLSLKMKLENEIPDTIERDEIIKRIQILEDDLEIN